MISKKRLLEKSRLYVILDRNLCRNKDPIDIFKKIKNKGIDIIQLRDKISPKKEILKVALHLKDLLNKNKTLFIINDFVDIAKIVNAAGVHLGQKDMDVYQARRILGANKIIGVSCHNLKQLIIAQRKGADYMAIGPVFFTSLKEKLKPLGLDILRKMSKTSLRKPIFAIGGINQSNLSKVLATGIRRIAVASAVCKSTKPALAIKRLNTQLNRNKE